MSDPRSLGRYRILGELGRGGMGLVYRARDERLDREVALKILPAELREDPDRLRRFEREARAASALRHPNIIHVYELGTEGDTVFLAMELVEGATLADRLAAGPLDEAAALAVARQVADALAEAHGRGIVHRDLKPENLMLDAGDRVTILDFGLARRVATDPAGPEAATVTAGLTDAGVVLGTIPYMSPEQALGRTVDARSDLFSLGVVLYECLAGERPFAGATAAELLTRVATAEPAPLAGYGVPAETARIVHRCLEKEPGRRYASAADLLSEMRNRERDRSGPAVAVAEPDGIRSLAVLPFENGSGDPDSTFLCDGLAEGLINTLSRSPALRVISRTSAFRFRDRADDVEAVGRALDVQAVLTGRLAAAGDRVSIGAELVDARDRSQLWGGRFVRTATDILDLEAELTDAIAGELHVHFGDPDGASAEEAPRAEDLVRRRHAGDPEAYRLYLRARDSLVGSSGQMDRSESLLEQAIERAPDYALAHATLGVQRLMQGVHGARLHTEAFPEGRASIERALELDPDLAEAYTALGILRTVDEWDWDGAEEAFRRGLELNPGSIDGHMEYAEYLISQARWSEVVAVGHRALELDPLSVMSRHALAIGSWGAGDLDAAIDEFTMTNEINPDWTWGYLKKAKACGHAGRVQEGLAAAARAEELLGDLETPLARAWLTHTYFLCGETERAHADATRIEAAIARASVDMGAGYMVRLAVGDTEGALPLMESEVERRGPLAWYLPSIPALYDRSLAGNLRYRRLLRLMGL